MLWHEIWIWPIQFLLFYVNQSFWGVCIREYRMCSYVLYMIMTSLFILKQFLFSERSCQLLPKHRDIFRNLKQWSDKLRTAFFKLLYTESRAPLQGFHFMVQHFSMWHFTINMKSICLCISDRSCQCYQDIWISSEIWSYVPCLTNFIQLSSSYCTVNPVNTTRLSFHGTAFSHVAEPWSGTVNNIWQWIQPTFEDKVT